MNRFNAFACSLLLLFTSGCPVLGEETVWLSSLDLEAVRQGWGKAQPNKSVTGKPLSIAGAHFDHGLGTHAESVIRLELKGCVRQFTAQVGVDDAANDPRASVIFRVVADRKTVWKSPVMRWREAAQNVDLNLEGVETVILLAGSAGDGTGFDHANWANARFEVSGGRPRVVGPPLEERVILTPPSPATPRINGAKIFGVRPGNPFLFTIPATGTRPMRFWAEGLPPGLTLDSDTGQITGSVAERGEYAVMFGTQNALGKTQRPFKIVVGERLALTPHMGWNSWYVWENHVTDKIIRDAAQAMVTSGLIDHGYMYVNIDDCWSVKPGSTDPSLGGEARAADGKINSNKRFPDMKALTDFIHSKGLKAGIYTSPGPLTCAGHVAAFEHEELDVQRFVEWGYDFLKYDWCSYGKKAKDNSVAELKKPYAHISGILERQKRDIVLNLCQYGMGEVWRWGKEAGGQSWRTAGDLGLTFEGIAASLFRDGFDVYALHQLHEYGGPGAWNDPDYLLLGFLSNWRGQTALTPLTPNEQYTHVSLWCLLAAPLILSGDITRLDEFTLSLLANDEVIAVDQDPLGKPARRVAKEEDIEVWVRPLEDGTQAVGLFNRGELEAGVTARWSELGLHGSEVVRDLWRQRELGKFDSLFRATVPRHGVVLVKIGKGAAPN